MSLGLALVASVVLLAVAMTRLRYMDDSMICLERPYMVVDDTDMDHSMEEAG